MGEHQDGDTGRLPVDPRTGQSIPAGPQPGYYPGFSTLDQQAFWDEATRAVVLDRVHNPPPIRFFAGEERALAQAVFDRVIPQDDRDADHRIPVLNYVDDRLYAGRIDGYRYEDMPPDGEAYRLGLRGIDDTARRMYGSDFTELAPLEQDDVLWQIHGDTPPEEVEAWKRMPPDRFWLMLVSDAVDAYYAHPYAWDEVGFGGPAYPRGYFRLENGQPEPWEKGERRYEWVPPPTSSSGQYKQLGGRHPHRAPAGQEGTH
ncbi:MAG TPA: gluconate 2-dehydrogenase subunit 3 family protein [Chloroflexota bacterium]